LVATALLVGVTSSHGSDGGLSPGSLLVMIECRFSLSSAGTGFVRLSLVYTPGELLRDEEARRHAGLAGPDAVRGDAGAR
jgi:hypothetical protein